MGPAGAQGPAGDQGPAGPQGPAGAAIQGSFLLMPEGVTPAGDYRRIGVFREERLDVDGKGGQKKFNLVMVLWQKL